MGRKTKSRRFRHAALLLSAAFLVPVLTLAGVAMFFEHKLTSQIDRIDNVFVGLPDRPPKATGTAAGAVNILLLGTDRRSSARTTGSDADAPLWLPGAQRSDTIMILHIDSDRRAASVISIPRDSWVMIPGHGPNKINAAFSFGGPSLAIRTVENLTNIRIDHLAVVDWNGFKQLTDTIGGVTLTVPATVHDRYRDITWTKGAHTLNGKQALDYVGQRAGLPGGDFDRIHRQQYFLKTLFDETLQQEFRKEPTKVYAVLNTLTRNLSVDSEWSLGDMRSLIISLRNLRSANIGYLTVPIAGTGMEGAQDVVHLDSRAGQDLWDSVRDDVAAQWLDSNQSSAMPAEIS